MGANLPFQLRDAPSSLTRWSGNLPDRLQRAAPAACCWGVPINAFQGEREAHVHVPSVNAGNWGGPVVGGTLIRYRKIISAVHVTIDHAVARTSAAQCSGLLPHQRTELLPQHWPLAPAFAPASSSD